MRKIILIPLIILSAITLTYAQSNQSEDIFTIVTYYPSPYGVYRNLRIMPSAEPDSTSPARQPGTLYFNESENRLYIFSGATNQFESVAGNISGELPLVMSAHTQQECVNAKGAVGNSDVGFKLCRFQGKTCPPGWTQYKKWGTGDGKTYSTTAGGSCCAWGQPGETCPVVSGCSCTISNTTWKDWSPKASPSCSCNLGGCPCCVLEQWFSGEFTGVGCY